MIVRTRFGDREVRAQEWGSSAVAPPSLAGIGDISVSGSGALVTARDAAGLAAVDMCVSLISETIGMLPLLVMNVTPGGERRKATDAWQWSLLSDGPVHPEASDMNVWEDAVGCVEYTGNAYLEKVKSANGRVVGLVPLDPQLVSVRRDADSRRKVFDVRLKDGLRETVGSDRVLHVRGRTIGTDLRGVSPITLHRETIGTSRTQQQWQGRFYRNNASPGGYISVPGPLSPTQAKSILRLWSTRHGGADQVNRPGILYNGAEWKATQLSLEDQQFIQTLNHSMLDILRIFRVPLSFANDPSVRLGPQAEQDSIRFVTYCLMPRLKRLESALRADVDLFGSGSLWPVFDVKELLRGDMKTRFEAWTLARQAGFLSGNEIRTEEGWPLVAGLDDVQQTPVGGAPNTTKAPPEPDGDEEPNDDESGSTP